MSFESIRRFQSSDQPVDHASRDGLLSPGVSLANRFERGLKINDGDSRIVACAQINPLPTNLPSCIGCIDHEVLSSSKVLSALLACLLYHTTLILSWVDLLGLPNLI